MRLQILFGLLVLSVFGTRAQDLTLVEAEQLALQQDPQAQIYNAQQAQFTAQGISGSQLPDPMIKLGINNVPVDSFALDDDPMTQFSVGIGQQFSRGDTRQLTAQKFQIQTQQSLRLSENRQAEIIFQIRQLWLDIRFTEIAQETIRKNKALFSQNIASLQQQFELGYKQNQDLIAAELELAKFDDKIAAFVQQEQALRGQLVSLIGPQAFDNFDHQLPSWQGSKDYVKQNRSRQNSTQHYQLLAHHPQVLAAQQAIDLADNSIETANESYKPAFKVELGYGHREAPDMDGSRRSDLISGVVSMDLPLFTGKRQDQVVAAATYGKGMKKAEKDLLLRKLNGQLNGAIANYLNSQQRMQRYQNTLLKQASQNSEATMQGYQANTNSFEQVIKAFMNEQTLELEYHQLHYQGLKNLARIRYFQAL